jgi:hypothetical protein
MNLGDDATLARVPRLRKDVDFRQCWMVEEVLDKCSYVLLPRKRHHNLIPSVSITSTSMREVAKDIGYIHPARDLDPECKASNREDRKEKMFFSKELWLSILLIDFLQVRPSRSVQVAFEMPHAPTEAR